MHITALKAAPETRVRASPGFASPVENTTLRGTAPKDSAWERARAKAFAINSVPLGCANLVTTAGSCTVSMLQCWQELHGNSRCRCSSRVCSSGNVLRTQKSSTCWKCHHTKWTRGRTCHKCSMMPCRSQGSTRHHPWTPTSTGVHHIPSPAIRPCSAIRATAHGGPGSPTLSSSPWAP